MKESKAMTIETLIINAQNAGFQVDTLYPYIIISLTNRAVSILEVATALNVSQSKCSRSGGSVLINL